MSTTGESAHSGKKTTLALSLGALGVVYGDIGTSPLYSIKECFHGLHAIELTSANVLGVLSLIFWSLTVVITVKYVSFILRADNKGEGGVFALLELLPKKKFDPRTVVVTSLLGLCGASLLCGEAVITPAISVLSAMEGLEIATDTARPLVVPLTLVILFGLFMAQKHGTDGIARVFGPVMVLWFLVIGGLGLYQIMQSPDVLMALNPSHALDFFVRNRFHGVVVLGSVVLCITGGEALYADMGHFGKRAIRLSWLFYAYPGLLLNYFGQGAGLISNPSIVIHPFYGIVPKAWIYPMVVLSTMATIIASQAMISGIFSIIRQAVQLGYYPRVRVIHTSRYMEGQIYIPEVNAFLMWGCIALVLIFKESSRLAAAYGIAVTATMTITSCLFFLVARKRWNWPLWKALPLLLLFCAFDVSFFGSNLLKMFDGGWIPVVIAITVVTCMSTWKAGRAALGKVLLAETVPLELFLNDVAAKKPHRAKGSAVFLSVSPTGAPVTLLHFFKHTKMLHEKVVIMSIQSSDEPYANIGQNLTISCLGEGFYRVVATYGFMQTPDVPQIMEYARIGGIDADPADTTFFLGRESLFTTGKSPMAHWRKRLFEFMSRNSRPASAYFNIPAGRVMELGVQVEL
ncbi:MAG: potassium transporter Kup [Desulfovibrio sp.]|nr:potassium transporter Kup [Desulfovibrio sp.]MBI4961194.1 potassium transporter Kup [Desulfovibrio sp.]